MARIDKLLETLDLLAEEGVDIPPSLMVKIANKANKARDIPIFNLNRDGLVPAPQKKGLILGSAGWIKEKATTIYNTAGGGSRIPSDGKALGDFDMSAYNISNANTISLNTGIVIDKASGKGIKVDTSDPTFGWADLLGAINTRPTAGAGSAAVPDYVAYRGNIYAFRFGTNPPNDHLHEAFIEFHIPHDHVPGTDIYLHAHWSQIVVDSGGTAGVPGVAKWSFDMTYADGHGTAGGTADPFVAPKTTFVLQQGSITQYGHMIPEVAITNNGGDSTHFDRNSIQIDGVILVRIYRDPADPADTLNQATFLHYCDLHYQTTGIGTKQKSPDFYT